MRIRPSSRLLILSPENSVLLFSFCHKGDALSGKSYWATPGGGLEDQESYEQAALRELFEETGLRRTTPGPQIASRDFTMMLPDGENVLAKERYFIIYAERSDPDASGWSRNEKDVIRGHHWWTLEELIKSDETIFPRDLIISLLKSKLAGSSALTPPRSDVR